MKNKLITTFVVLLLVSGAWIYFQSSVDVSENESEEAVDTSSWSVYTNEEFDFELKYPADDWNMVEAPDDLITPKFNFYIKPQGVPVDTPITHHSNVTNVSVFPEGIPTEGVIGQTGPLENDWGDGVSSESRIYTLEDGTPFAAYIKYEETPESWNESGFVWARLGSQNLEGVCFENGVEMDPSDRCDPLGNEDITIRHRGDVDSSLWPEIRESVRSVELDYRE